MASSTSFALVVWKGKDPTWSIVDSSTLDSTPTPGETTYALWGNRNKKYQCEILALTGTSKLKNKLLLLTHVLIDQI